MASARQSSSIASGANKNTNAGKPNEILESREPRTCRAEKNLQRVKLSHEIYCTINARDVLLSVDLVTYMSICEALSKTCSSNATTAKIWNLRNFCQFLLAKNWK